MDGKAGLYGYFEPREEALLRTQSGLEQRTRTCSHCQSVLDQPAITQNKPARVHDFSVTHKELLAVLGAESGPFTVQDIAVPQLAEHCNAGLARGEFTEANTTGLLQAHAFGAEESTCVWPENDDSIIPELPWRDIGEGVKEVLSKALSR
jgi:hypothetical protein